MSSAPSTLPAIDGLPPGLAVIEIGHSPGRRRRAAPGFAPLALPRRRWAASDYGPRYCVFPAGGEGVWVEAASAVEAIGKSGVTSPVKVVRGQDARAVGVALVSEGRLEPVPAGDAGGPEPAASDPEAPAAAPESAAPSV